MKKITMLDMRLGAAYLIAGAGYVLVGCMYMAGYALLVPGALGRLARRAPAAAGEIRGRLAAGLASSRAEARRIMGRASRFVAASKRRAARIGAGLLDRLAGFRDRLGWWAWYLLCWKLGGAAGRAWRAFRRWIGRARQQAGKAWAFRESLLLDELAPADIS